MRRVDQCLFLVPLGILSLIGGSSCLCQGTAKSFSPMSDTSVLANPGKGFYHTNTVLTSQYQPVDLTALRNMITNEKITLLLMEIVLDNFVTSNISSTILNKIRTDFSTVRSAGIKSIVRFAYTETEGNMKDAKLPQLRAHIVQLGPILKDNADVILTVQTGFVGTWGEWYYSLNYATAKSDGSYDPSPSQQVDRNTIVTDLLNAVFNTRQIQLRTPTYKQRYCGTTSNLSPSQAFSTTNLCARIGIHNDCFMASGGDMGTFENDAQRTWLSNEGLYTIVGGESCEVNSKTGCTQGLDQILKQRFTYLNVEYHDKVIANWKSEGCYNAIANKLGYRFVLVNGVFPASVARGTSYCATINVTNTGVAPIYNTHNLLVILRNKSTGTLSSFMQQGVDIRQWAPGTTATVDLKFVVPSTLVSGTYDVLLSLPDSSSTLANNRNYQILFANSGNVQETSSRYNLLAQVSIA